MGLFRKKAFKEIDSAIWGILFKDHKIDVDTLSREFRYVDRQGSLEDETPVTFLRVFRLSDARDKGINVTGWGTFDEHPDLIFYEGYLNQKNEPYLQQRKS